VVLIRVLALVVLAGCSESLLGAHHAGGEVPDAPSGTDGGELPGACTGSCITDAAAAFDGSVNGVGNYWRYYDDGRDQHSWEPMTPATGGQVGEDPRNHITTCAARPDAIACQQLPGALLISAAGPTSAADPAIAFVTVVSQTLELRLRVAAPTGAPVIRLYRNSREDELFTQVAATAIDQTVTLDALAGDRFLVAVAPPTDAGASDIGLDLTVRAGGVFPTSCQLAVGFEVIVGNSVTDVSCRGAVFLQRNGTVVSPPMQGPPPYQQLRSSIRIPEGTSLELLPADSTIDYTGDVTVQLWMFQEVEATSTFWAFSDIDSSQGGGLGISLLAAPAKILDVVAGTSAATRFVHATAPYPGADGWHFIRVVRSRTDLRVCIDGQHATTIDAPATAAASHAPALGREADGVPSGAVFDGELDDLRVITGALPCDQAR
jgi:hypothetical protein